MPKGELFVKYNENMGVSNNARYSYDATQHTFSQSDSGLWVDTYIAWGVSFSEKGLSTLMTPAPNKKSVENKSRTKNGKQVLKNPTLVKKDERTINIEMHLTASTKEEFWRRYDGFCSDVLDFGFVTLINGHVPGKVFRMEYESCNQFSEFMQQLAMFTLRLNEPDPTDRDLISVND